jgi:hypothetical protein
MKVGELVIIYKSPWNVHAMFGYKNGNLAIVLRYDPTPSDMIQPSVRVFVFETEKTITIPVMYVKKIGD